MESKEIIIPVLRNLTARMFILEMFEFVENHR